MLRRRSSPTRALAAAAVVLGLAEALTGCGSDKGTGDKGYVDGDGVITVLPVSQRKAPGTVAGRTLQDKPISLADFAGKPVVVNVWGSWCPPCRAESGTLTRAAHRLGSSVGFLGINVRDPGGTDRSRAFERRFKVTYPSIYDPSGRSLLAFDGTVSLYSIPATVVLDSKGRVAASIIGPVPSTRTLEDVVDDVEKGVA